MNLLILTGHLLEDKASLEKSLASRTKDMAQEIERLLKVTD